MKVLVACEESQTVCKAFRMKGHEAYSCDIVKPSGGHPEWHILGNAIPILTGGQITTMNGAMEVLGFGPDRLNRLYDEMRHNYDQMNTWGKEDGIDVAMERMRKCACDALKTDDIVVEDVEDSKELAAQRQHYHAQEVEFLKRAALAATGRKSCAKVLNVFDASAMDRKMAAVRDAAVGEAFRRRV